MLTGDNCRNCGKPLIAKRKRPSLPIYCSHRCHSEWRGRRPSAYGKLSLGRGIWTLVDEIDAIRLRNGQNWVYSRDTGYASRLKPGIGEQGLLSREIMEYVLQRKLDRREFVDHKNGDRLDNRRTNLRLATAAQNAANRNSPVNTASGFTGVRRERRTGGFRARVMFNEVTLYIGSFSTAEEAAWMRDQWAIELWGEYASLNLEYV